MKETQKFLLTRLHYFGFSVFHVVHSKKMKDPMNDEQGDLIVDPSIVMIAPVIGGIGGGHSGTDNDISQ